MSEELRYSVSVLDAGARVFEVSLELDHPDPAGQQFALPAWLPGSYLIREFARYVLEIGCSAGGSSMPCRKLDKATWVCAATSGPLRMTARIYAGDQSVRGAYLDTRRGFFDGACLLFRAVGHESVPCSVILQRPADERLSHWRLATAMPPEDVDDHGFGRYRCENYEALIDHPVEMGAHQRVRFAAAGIPHDFVVAGRHDGDLARVATDLARICETHAALFGPPPVDRYVFLGQAVGEGYGGLEHRNSSALMFRRQDLPGPDTKAGEKDYRRFLGLCSHEYFHLWNVKRIKPAAFSPYQLERESYTALLWVFEGITSYYDDLALVRSGVIDTAAYLELLAQTVTRVRRGAGRQRQSVAESSFDAWIKFYRPDDNTPNAVVSYYSKGALVAFGLDMELRRRSGDRCDLDRVMRRLWERYGRTPAGLPEDGFERLVNEVAGLDLSDYFDLAVRGTADLPLEEQFAEIGVTLSFRAPASAADLGGPLPAGAVPQALWLGAELRRQGESAVVGVVTDGSPARKAGLVSGDRLVALDGLRITDSDSAEALLRRRQAGERLPAHVFRGDELLVFDLVLEAAPRTVAALSLVADADEAACRRREAWLWQGAGQAEAGS